jgi:hypothetical protein
LQPRTARVPGAEADIHRLQEARVNDRATVLSSELAQLMRLRWSGTENVVHLHTVNHERIR